MSGQIDLFKTILTNEFNIGSFTTFAKEFFNDLEVVRPDKFMDDGWNWSEFNFYIKGYYHIGNFIGDDKAKVAVFAVELKDYKNIDRARSMQRNFVKKLMSAGNADGAIVAFYAEDEAKWRLSFVRMDYEFAKGKVTEKLTPAKRYSYLVGKGEPCHTAQERLLPIFENVANNPTLDTIEEAFSVEKVTKEFFDRYSDKYYQLKEELEKNKDFLGEAKRHNFTPEQFAKKLMGQIAFLYFVQKKGWLGVNAIPRILTGKEYKNAFYSQGKASQVVITKVYKKISEDEYKLIGINNLSEDEELVLSRSVKGMPWGTGPKDFMRKLFETCKDKGGNFFDDYLEPLFYEALNENRGEAGYFTKLHCRIPFLNGGLFEPLENYDWNHNDFHLDNSIFSNRDEKGERDADGILDIFDRYNFTMNEDEPLEREVAIDPEMLGKIFENLLDGSERKSKGAFYTPREIVHYMCQESLANYLVNETGIAYEDIKDFIIYGEFMKDEDTSYGSKVSGEMYIPESIFSRKKGINRLDEIDKALANVKVADPSVGSGAFPLGMVSEIVKLRKTITAYLALDMNEYQIKMMHEIDRHPYKLKLETIKNSIFAVDIDASAIDITKLRLWLSLVVEQQTNERVENELFIEGRNPRPLPNLDCNIRCGNSLIDEFEGVKLINESTLFGDNNVQMMIGQNPYEGLLNQLFEAQDKLFYENNHQTKDETKKKIRNIIDTIIMFNMSKAAPEIIKRYNELKYIPSPPWFVWQLEFAKVFKDKKGFDIVIGNPPYVDSETMVKRMPEERILYSKMYTCAKGNWDLYIPFWEKAFNLLSNTGCAAFITPNKWLAIKYGEKLRELLFDYIYNISDFSTFNAFESADVSTITAFIKKAKSQEIVSHRFNETYQISNTNKIAKKYIKPFDNLSLCLSDSFATLSKLLDFKPLGQFFDCNEAATVSETYEIAKYLVDVDEFNKEEYFKFINTGTIDKYESLWGKESMTYVKNKYLCPAIKKENLRENFKRRYAQANSPKIITTGIRYFECYLDDKGEYLAAKSTVIITPKQDIELKCILPILNSNLIFYFLKEAYSGLAMGGGVNFTANNLSKIPIPDLNMHQKEELSKITISMNSIEREKFTQEMDKIDRYIYELYNLNEEDILIMDKFKEKSKRKKKIK